MRKKKKNKKTKKLNLGRDFVNLAEHNYGSGTGFHESKKDKLKRRTSKQNQKIKNKIRRTYGQYN